MTSFKVNQEVVRLHDSMYRTYRVPPKLGWSNFLIDRLTDGSIKAFYEPEGFATAALWPSPHDADWIVRGLNLWVEPEHRGAGLGARLSQRVIEWAAGRRVEWMVDPENKVVKMYERLGMRRDPRVTMTT